MNNIWIHEMHDSNIVRNEKEELGIQGGDPKKPGIIFCRMGPL